MGISTVAGFPTDRPQGRRAFLRTIWRAVVGRVLDGVALLGSGTVALLLARRAIAGSRDNPIIKISGAHDEWLLPLGVEQEVLVAGPIGVNRVVVAGGEARVMEAPCANQICVHTGSISAPGQWIACLPNRVLVSVESAGEQIDARSY